MTFICVHLNHRDLPLCRFMTLSRKNCSMYERGAEYKMCSSKEFLIDLVQKVTNRTNAHGAAK